WQGQNGVLGAGDTSLLRGLGAAHNLRSTTVAIRQYVGDYIAVQFNAVTDLATTSGTNIYRSSWMGPASANFSGTNQTIALSALTSAIGLDSTSVGIPPSTESDAPSAPRASKSKPRVAAILGGVFGGGIAVALAVGFAGWLLRRRR
ncbi:hypothetical protein B0H17DRAFT_904258, partial [Mycena rosella]